MTLVLFAADPLQYLFGSLTFLTSLFLILLVLVQRGRGGGLTGALGGMGGQSAFGAKAGDTFTRVTMITATIWILLCIGAIKFLSTDRGWGQSSGGPEVTAPGATDSDADATDDVPSGGASAGDGTGGLDASPAPPSDGAAPAPTDGGSDAAPATPAPEEPTE